MMESDLVIGSGYRPFREYVLRGLTEAFRLVLIGSALDWQLLYAVDHREATSRTRLRCTPPPRTWPPLTASPASSPGRRAS